MSQGSHQTVDFDDVPAGGEPGDTVAEEPLYRFRDDLVITQQGDSFLIKDPVKGSFARLGSPEFLVGQYFDGRSNLMDIKEKLKRDRDVIVNLETLERFRKTLHEKQLLLAPGERVTEEEADLGMANNQSVLARLVLIPIPLKINPDVFLTRLHHKVKGIFFNKWFIAYAVVAFALSLQIWVTNWTEIVYEARQLGTIRGLVIFYFIYAFSVSCHEIAHGLTTKAFGGEVRRMGLFLYYLNVAFYTDVSDAWMFDKKSRQILVIFAGAFTNIILLCTATILWRLTVSDTGTSEVLMLFMIMNAFGTSFTLTPFLRGDGYHMLSSWLEIPNLREKSFDYLRTLLRRRLLGADEELPKVTDRERRVFVVYAILTYLFLVAFTAVVAVNLGWFLTYTFGAWGFLLILFVLIDRLPIRSGIIKLIDGLRARLREGPNRATTKVTQVANDEEQTVPPIDPMAWLRANGAKLGLGVAAACVLLLAPYRLTVNVPFTVVTLDNRPTTAKTDGQVREVFVSSGDWVEEGQLMVKLEDRDLLEQRAALVGELEAAQAHLEKMENGFREEDVAAARAHKLELKAAWDHARLLAANEKSLFDQGYTSKENYEKLRADSQIAAKRYRQAREEHLRMSRGYRPEKIAQARSQVDQLEEDLAFLDQHIEWTAIRAPRSGTVQTADLHISRLPGRMVYRGETLFFISPPEAHVVRVELPEHDVEGVKNGLEVLVRPYRDPTEEYVLEIDDLEKTVSSSEGENENGGLGLAEPRELHAEVGLHRHGVFLPVGTTGKAKVKLGTFPVGYVIYRRLANDHFVDFWSWW